MSKSVCDIKFYGFDELAKSLNVADNVLKKAIEDCMKKSAELPKRDMLDFMAKHKVTGVTERSFKDLDITWQGNVCTGAIGFDIPSGGLPAVFLDKGTPKIRPKYFIYYAVTNNAREIEKIQRETLKKILGG